MDFITRTDFPSWGRVVRTAQRVAHPAFSATLGPALRARAPGPSLLGVGWRRSYGDSCLNSEGEVLDLTSCDRFIAFDRGAGVVRAEAGLTLSALLRLAVPQGFFLPTTPGTRFVTLGGAVANDVHGKNHHRAGSFGRHVRRIGLLRSSGERLELSREQEPELFAATIGGLGLTGIIEWVELALAPVGSALLDVDTIPYGSLSEFWDVARESAGSHEHTVSWIDCTARGSALGRGIFSRGNWRDDADRTVHSDRTWKRVPLEAPSTLLNSLTVRAFNEANFRLGRMKRGTSVQHYAPFFYPLDAIADWNRLYGKRGMYQYQCVVPPATQADAVHALLEAVSAAGEASFLAVLKTFGDLPSPGLLSFPREGATLALDFPNRGDRTLTLLDRLDAIVREAGGRLYPAKDGRMSSAMFRSGYPGWERFAALVDPGMESDFWRRVKG